MIYLDNAATTAVSPEAISAYTSCLAANFGNPGSIHAVGRSAAKLLAEARQTIADCLHARADQILFTSGATEANDTVFFGLPSASHLSRRPRHMLVSSVEHPSVLQAAKQTELFDGVTIVDLLPVGPDGRVTPETLLSQLRPETTLVSIMTVNNELGTRNDIAALSRICHERGILFHTDAVQAFGLEDIDVSRDPIDFLTISGHKIHAPKGIGALYVRDRSFLQPLLYGGGQEDGLRSGTENVPGIVAFAAAARAACDYRGAERHRNDKNREALLRRLTTALGYSVHLNAIPSEGSRIMNLRFDGLDGESLVLALSALGVMVSAGSACSAHTAEPSHVLRAIGLTDDQARSSLRISFSYDTTLSQIREAADAVVDCVRAMEKARDDKGI